MRRHHSVLLACVLALGGCEFARDELEPSRVSARGVPPTLEQLDLQVRSRTTLVNNFIEDAGYPPNTVLEPVDRRWSLVTEAGLYIVTRQCDQYLDALFRFNRNQRAGRQGLAATAGATGAILGLANAAASAIAITAAAFGLAGSLFDASVGSVLFTIEPSALRNVVMQGRRSYLQELPLDRINTRPAMLMAVQGYLAQCSPAAIEANINNAANGSPYAVTARDEADRRLAARLAAPGLSLLQRAEAVITTPSQPTPRPPTSALAVHADPLREPNATQPVVSRVQAALGQPVNGILDEGTRRAIREFQAGLRARDPNWTAIDGLLRDRTLSTLRFLPPLSTTLFATPFERAYLSRNVGPESERYRAVDQLVIDSLLTRRLRVPDNELPSGTAVTDADMQARVNRLRSALEAARQRQNAPAPRTPREAGELDLEFYRFLVPN